jgi:hypothetical protein
LYFSFYNSFFTNLVLQGNLYTAFLKALFANSSLTHSSSNKTTQGNTTATYNSTDHLPEPIGTSDAFLVTGLCGKIFIHNFHCLFK